MRTTALQPGTEVEVDIRGRVFPARITGKADDGRFPIRPLIKNVGYFSATARQIKKVLRRASDTQLQLGGTA
jgi:hypothetical protein